MSRALRASLLLVLSACGGSTDLASPADQSAASQQDGSAPVVHSDASAAVDASDAGAGNTTAADTGSGGEDATSNGVDAAAIPELADCLASPYEMHVVASGGYGNVVDGASGVTGAQGTWSGRVTSESLLQLDIQTGGGWVFGAATDFVHGQYLAPGTYPVGEPGRQFPYAQVEVDGKACGAIPAGTFTIVDVGSTGGDEASLTRLLAWFDLTCAGQGKLRGCVRYGE